MGQSFSPAPEFNALAKRYALQRSRGVFPSGMFWHAQRMEWVSVNAPASQLDAPSHRPLNDAELSALAGKPVFDIRIAPTKHTPKQITWKLSKAGARAHWRVVQEELKKRMGPQMFAELEKPRQLREDFGSELSAYSFALDMKQDPNFPQPPPLPQDHPLHGFSVPMDWPMRRRSYVSDISVIRIHPTNFGPKQLWEHLNGLSSARFKNLRMPKQDDLYLMLQGHELGHTLQPQPDQATHNESYYGEYHADWFMSRLTTRLGINPGNLDAFQAARVVTSQCFTNAFGPSAWSCHSVTPAIFFGGFKQWPIRKLNATRRQLRAYTDLMLVGEDCNLTAEEIQAFTAKDEKYFKQFDKRKEEVSRQLARARLAEERVNAKPALKIEGRLLAMKKIWNDKSLKVERELLFMVGHTLEAAALFWPDLKDPQNKLTAAKCAPFRPRKRPAPAAT